MMPPREFLRELYDEAVKAAQPAVCVPPALPGIPQDGELILLAVGKAASAMAKAALDHYAVTVPDRLDRIRGLVTTRHGYDLEISMEQIEAGHPVPDENSERAGRKALEIANSAHPGDIVLVLISGGGSALWSVPVAPLDLAGKQAITRALLRSGANIAEINTVRRHISEIKGGGLAAAVPENVPLITLAISDVPGDNPAEIASGPTCPGTTTGRDALEVCQKYRIDLPDAVHNYLRLAKISPRIVGDNEYRLVATPAIALKAAADKARTSGLEVINLGDALEGEARELGKEHAEMALAIAQQDAPTLLMSGGELTVTMRGNGKGGPSQEYALGLAIGLQGHDNIHAIACDTDGADGGSGADDDPAGAFVAPDTLKRANLLGMNPQDFLDNNDSTRFFKGLGDLVVTGPTYTNVNDFRAIMVNRIRMD